MAKRREDQPERKVLVTIRSSIKRIRNSTVTLESWKFWEIVEELRCFGADRITAYDAAKWAGRANPGDGLTVTETIRMEVME